MTAQADRDPLSRLYDHATPEETDVLDELRTRAGLIWGCGECGSTNQAEYGECQYCDAPRLLECGCPASLVADAGHQEGCSQWT